MSIVVSGATTISANDFQTSYGNAVVFFSSTNITQSCSATVFVTGLTPGTNTFKIQYYNGGNTGRWGQRALTITALT